MIGDLSSRRGKIGGMTQRGDAQVVAADVPLAEMFGYSTTLRSMTQGRAVYSMEFDHYEEVPKTMAEADHHARRQARLTAEQVTQRNPDTRQDSRDHGQGEIRADEAARERGDDRARGPRQDHLTAALTKVSADKGWGTKYIPYDEVAKASESQGRATRRRS